MLTPIAPKILTFIATHTCTSACKGCCFACSPKKRSTLSAAFMKRIVDCVVSTMPSIQVVVFTGGECTLLRDDLFETIAHCSRQGLNTRIVSNGHWAIDDAMRAQTVSQIAASELTEINFSTGSEHQKFVPLSAIAKAITDCANVPSIKAIAVNIEAHSDVQNPNEHILGELKQLNDEPSMLLLQRKLLLLNSPWMGAYRSHELSLGQINSRHCDNLFSGIYINPEQQMLACCGLSCEHIPFLKLGRVLDDGSNLQSLYQRQYNDLLKLWLYTEGPTKMLQFCGAEHPQNTHVCEDCLNLLLNEQHLRRLMSISQEKANSLLLSHQLKAAQQS